MPIDPSIALQIKPPEFMTPAQAVSLKDMATQGQIRELGLQQARFAQQQQAALRQALSQPGAVDPTTGMPTGVALANISRIDPAAASQIRQQMLEAQRTAQQFQTSKTQEQKALTELNEKRLKITQDLKSSALNVYDEAISSGVSQKQAMEKAQQHFLDKIDETKRSGVLGDAGDPGNTKFDPDTFRAQSLTYKDKQAQTETARHHRALEDAAGKRIENAAGDESGELTPEDLAFMAKQAWAGDRSVFQNLGRGKQGSKNLIALRRAVREEGERQGMTGEELAAATAEFEGAKAGQRTLGTKTANIEMAVNEAAQFADLALEASEKFPRGKFVPINRALAAYKGNTGDPAVRAFGAANTSFINAYARAVSPSGSPTVSDKDHAREMLSTADGPVAYAAVIKQLQAEMAAAQKSPGQVKKDMRERMTGKDTEEKPAKKAVHWDDLQ
jgi:hypothetical protein